MKIWQKKGIKVRDHIDQFTVGDDREWDMRLAPYDIIASKAHAQMLGKVGLLTASEANQLTQGLDDLLKDVEKGIFTISEAFEDVHSKIEFELTEKYGDVGKKYTLLVRETIKFSLPCNSFSKMRYRISNN